MEFNYHCPKCKTCLTKGKAVEFEIRSENGNSSLIHLDSSPEGYEYITKGNYTPSNGEIVAFYCPTCGEKLNSKDKKMVKIQLWVNELIKFDVFFSAETGKKETYILIDGELEKYNKSTISLFQS